jgi:hypothetical protein
MQRPLIACKPYSLSLHVDQPSFLCIIDRVAIVVEGCSVCLGHIDSGTPALLLHMARDAEIVGSGDV